MIRCVGFLEQKLERRSEEADPPDPNPIPNHIGSPTLSLPVMVAKNPLCDSPFGAMFGHCYEYGRCHRKSGKYIDICHWSRFGERVALEVGAHSCRKVEREKMSSLKKLELNGAGIREIPAYAFTCFSSLEELYLGHNKISSLNRQMFAGLSSLKKLSLFGATTLPL